MWKYNRHKLKQCIYIQVPNQALQLIHVFKLRVILLADLGVQALQ